MPSLGISAKEDGLTLQLNVKNFDQKSKSLYKDTFGNKQL